MRKIKQYTWKLIMFFLLGVSILLANYKYISYSSSLLIFDTTGDIPKTTYALFLGTPKYLTNGDVNNYYKNRIDAATALYQADKVQKMIISADTLNKYGENEVALITSDLIDKGIDEVDIIQDHYGNSTWNSLSYIEKETSIDTIVLISQKFHLERALYIAKEKNTNAVGYEADGKMSTRLWIREVLARVKMHLDILKG